MRGDAPGTPTANAKARAPSGRPYRGSRDGPLEARRPPAGSRRARGRGRGQQSFCTVGDEDPAYWVSPANAAP